MTWTDWGAFVQMGGHAAYVWGSVAAALLMMAFEQLGLAARERDSAAHGEGEFARGPRR